MNGKTDLVEWIEWFDKWGINYTIRKGEMYDQEVIILKAIYSHIEIWFSMDSEEFQHTTTEK